jgi:hypothetical protein
MLKITKKYNIIVILPFIFIFWHCSNSSKSSKVNSGLESAILMEPNNIISISIPLNKETQYVFQSGTIVINNNGEEEFWGLDAGNNAIIIFDLTKKIISRRIEISKDGPMGIENILNFHVNSLDSIFIIPANTGKIFLIDSSAKVINQWNYQSLTLPSGESLSINFPFPIAEFGSNFFYQKKSNNLTIPLWLRGSGDFYRVPPIINYNLNSNKIVGNFGEYPENYIGNQVSIKDHFNIINLKNGDVIASFEESHYIQKYSSSGEYLGELLAKSNFVDKFTLFNKLPEAQISKNYWLENSFYIGLLYDSYKDLIYRIVYHGQPIKSSDGRFNKMPMADWSIIILTPTGDLIGEMKFEGSKYRFNDGIYISEKGIMVSLENPYNESNFEESLDFDLFLF